MRAIAWFKDLCDYLEGARDAPPAELTLPLTSPLWGLWWAVLLIIILVFSGQTSKFIYIDF
jgi:hypothetical protein